MKLGKIFICINILVLSLLMLTGCTGKGESWPRIVYQPTYWTFDNRIIDIDDDYILDDGHSYDVVETEDGYHFVVEYRPCQFGIGLIPITVGSARTEIVLL